MERKRWSEKERKKERKMEKKEMKIEDRDGGE